MNVTTDVPGDAAVSRSKLHSVRRAWLYLPLALLLGQTAEPQYPPEANSRFVDALWVSQHGYLSKHRGADGSRLFDLSGPAYRTIAIDSRRSMVWGYDNGLLNGYGFGGEPLYSVTVDASSSTHVGLVANPEDGSVWLGVNKTIHHYSSQAEFIGSVGIGHQTVALDFDADSQRLWVAHEKGVSVYDSAGNHILDLNLGTDNVAVKAFAHDPASGAFWVVLSAELRRYDAAGKLQRTVNLSGIEHVAVDSAGNLWAADSKIVFRIDSATGSVLVSTMPFDGEGTVDAVAADPAAVGLWVAGNRTLRRLNEDGVTVSEQHVAAAVYDLAMFHDTVEPVVRFVAPEADSYVRDARAALRLMLEDAGIGVDYASLSFELDGQSLQVKCATANESTECIPEAKLPEGQLTIAAVVSDYAGNESVPAEVGFTVDTIAPLITITQPQPGLPINTEQVVVEGHLSETAALTFDGTSVDVRDSNEFETGSVALTKGPNTFDLEAIDDAGNRTTDTLSIILDTVPPSLPVEALIGLTLNNGLVTISGRSGSVEPGTEVIITNLTTGQTVRVTAGPDGSFAGQISGNSSDTLRVQIVDAAGNSSDYIEVAINQAPVLEAVVDRDVPVGSVLNFTLSASDPNGDPLRFSAAPLPLPGNATLDALSGEFAFRPVTEDAGQYQLTFSVTDGAFVVYQSVTITVPAPDLTAPTRFTGRLLDANDSVAGKVTPIVGAIVSFLNTGRSAISDHDGYVSIDNLPSGTQVLDIDPSTAGPAPDDSSYAGFREQFTLEPNAHNLVERPFFLPRIDEASLTPVDPDLTTVVRNDDLGVVLEVPPHSARNADGSEFIGSLSISNVPPDFAPAALPDFLDLGLLITIQPVGVIFVEPASITFPNLDDMPPGSEADIWSLDPESGLFVIVGVGRVTADAQRIETVSGGIRAADWHAPAPPHPDGEGQGDKPNCGCGATAETGSEVNVRSGWLSSSFHLPEHYSLGEAHGLEFVYRSERADPQPVVPFDLTIPVRAAVPPTVSYSASIGGIALGDEVFVNTSGLSESVDETIRGVVAFDARELQSGLYPYTLRTTSNYSRTRVSGDFGDTLAVVNDIDSSFGSGWGIDGLTRLIPLYDGGVMIVNGGGSVHRFKPKALSLADWKAINTGGSRWAVSGDGNSVTQLVNAGPTIFSGPNDLINTTLRGRIRVNTSGDDDFVGFVFGYTSPLSSSNEPVQALLFDWKQNDQTSAREGFTLSRLNGLSLSQDGGLLWSHQEQPPKHEVLARSISSTKGWKDRTNHNFEVGYYSDRIHVKIDGQTVFDISGAFSAGRFGFYNFSQSNVTYELYSSIGAFESLDGDFSTLVGFDDGTYARTLKNGTRYEYDAVGLQTAVVDRNGNTMTFDYDAQQRLIRITDSTGRVSALSYSGDRLVSVTDPAGRVTGFAYDTAGNMVRVTFPDGTARSFGYDERHRMTSESDERGFATTREFDSTGRLVKTVRPDGTTRVATNIHTYGLVDLQSGIGTDTNPVPFLRPGSVVATFEDGNGHVTTMQTDGFGNLTRTTDPNGLTTLIDRDADGKPIRTVRPDGSETVRAFDSAGNRLTLTEQFNGARMTNTYDSRFNLLTSATDPRGNTSVWQRDSLGNVVKAINAQGHETAVAYESRGLVERVTDPNGRVVDYVYNIAGLIDSRTESSPDGGPDRVTTYEYDDAGQRTRVTTPDGVVIQVAYDPRGRVKRVSDNLGQTTEYTYDASGNRVRTDTLDADGTLVESTTQTFDVMNRPRIVSRPHGDDAASEVRYQYDGAGLPVGVTNPNGNATLQIYDPGDRLSDVIDPLDGVTHFDYDHNGNMIGVTAPNGAHTQYVHDPLGRQLRETSPDRGSVTNTYDLASNVQSVSNARGTTATLTYDVLNRVTRIAYPDSTEDVEFGYDSCEFGIGRLCSRTDESGTVQYRYDAFGNVTRTDYTISGITYSTVYEYDADDRLVGITLPSGRAVDYARDALGRIESIGAEVNGSSISLSSQVRYRADGALTRREFGNGISEARAYDLQGRLVSRTVSTIDSMAYDYDANGNVLSRQSPSLLHAYDYDALDRLIGDVVDGEGIGYTYDGNDNRLTEDDGTSQIPYVYQSSSNRLTDVGDAALVHDAAGSLIDDGRGRTYTYNDANRLEQVLEQGEPIAAYIYNADGLRIRKITPTGEIIFHYDLVGNLLAETRADGTPVRDYLWQDGEPVAQIDIAGAIDTVTYLHTDHLATPRLGTDAAGAIVWSWKSRAFGDTSPDEDPDGDGVRRTVNLRFPGQYADGETGLHYNWNRYYDPETGRYVTSDPIGLQGGVNTYSYVFSNPLRHVDTLGLKITGRVSSISPAVVRNVSVSSRSQSPIIRDRRNGNIYGWIVIEGDVLIIVTIDCEETGECGEVRSWTILPDFWLHNVTHRIPLRNIDLPLAYEALLAIHSLGGGIVRLRQTARGIANHKVTGAWATLMCTIFDEDEDTGDPGGPLF